MEETTYADEAVIKAINEGFVAVRVDNDRNPDINLRYNMGGWPTTVFLTCRRDIITGATYVPPHQMLALLERVSAVYNEQGDRLVEKAREFGQDREVTLGARPRYAKLIDFQDILDCVRAGFDTQSGGFGYEQKFPHTNALELLIFDYERSSDPQDLELVARTLEAMINGDIFDRIEGGMFRYATRRDWTVPHYEKLLDDNAKIASVLLDAYRIDHRPEFLDVAKSVFSYVEDVLISPETGTFYGSQDADENYYKLDGIERRDSEAPAVDTAIYTDSNALMALAYLKLWAVTGNEIARRDAARIVDFLNSLPRSEDGTVGRYYEDGEAREFGNLTDQAFLALANAACFEATGIRNYLDQAISLAQSLMTEFESDSGAFYDISERRSTLQGLSRFAVPLDENATVARSLLKLADLTGDSDYRLRAQRALDALAGTYVDYGVMASGYGIAVALANLDPVVVTVNGAVGDSDSDKLIQVSMEACGFRCTVSPVQDDDETEAAATICVGSVCSARVTDPLALADELAQAVSA